MKNIYLDNFTVVIDEEREKIAGIFSGEQSLIFSALSWSVEFADKSVIVPCGEMQFSYENKNGLTLLWQSPEVRVSLRMFSAEGMLKSSISVASAKKAISRIYYPVYEGVNQLCDDELLLPWQNGLSIKNPIQNLISEDISISFWMGRGGGKYENEYPAQYSYQLLAYYSGGGAGYYMSCDDGRAYIKTMGVYLGAEQGTIDFRFVNYPENMGNTFSYSQPYNCVFCFIDNGWRSAVRIYREWAKRQKWYTPLGERGLSNTLNKIDFVRINHEHYRLGTDDSEYFETAKMIKERLDCTPLMHWYGWNKAPKHGYWYPEMADWLDSEWYKGLKVRNAQLDSIGVKKIPYVNVHLWDKNLKSFYAENAEECFILPESLEISDEPWLPEGNLYAVCHATEKVKKKARDLFSHLVSEDGFDGIYIDQVASFNATLCFSENHGHPVGGGSWWADEYHNMIGAFRESMPKSKILTTESCCECYHDLFDMFLILDTSSQNTGFSGCCGADNVESLPLFAMIYGDSAIAYGSGCKLEGGDDEFEFNYIRNILFGMIPTVEGAELAYKDESAKWEVMKKGVDFFKENREVLLYGILDDYLTFGDNAKAVKFGKQEKHCPEVVSTVYKYMDRDYIFAYNYSDSEKDVHVKGKKLRIAPGSFVKI
jgi:hypothetical protein